MEAYDLVISNGLVVDGTGKDRFYADIAIRNGLIEKIGKFTHAEAKETLDATGFIVAPGVIDPHTHYDATIHWDPYCTNSALHGTTTVVVGNCGFGFSPCRPEHRERYMKMMETTEQVPLSAMQAAIPWAWESFPQWMEYMRGSRKGINMASFMPLNSLLIYVMGVEAAKSRRANTEEMVQMKALLNEAMDCGAIGFALSHLEGFNSHVDADGSPMPTDTMFIEDAYELASVLKERGEGAIQCLCDLPAGIDNREVAENLARITNRPILHNVIVAFDAKPDYHKDRLAWLEKVRAEGLNIYSQALCLRAWNQFNCDDWNAWNSTPIFREFSTKPSKEEKLNLLRDPDYRQRLREQYQPLEMYAAGGPLETYTLADVAGHKELEQWVGKTVGEIADAQDKHVTDAFMDINIATGLEADFMAIASTSTDPDKVSELMASPFVMAGTSDGGAHIKFFTGGQFSTDMLTWLVRDEGRFTLEYMHKKMSAFPAQVIGLTDRGTLEVGKAADIIVYDYEAFGYELNRYTKVNDLPDGSWRRECEPTGMQAVFVNGECIMKNNQSTGTAPGRMLGLG